MWKWYESRLELDKSGGRKTATEEQESNSGRNEGREKRDKVLR